MPAAKAAEASILAQIGTTNIVLALLLAAGVIGVFYQWIWRQFGVDGWSATYFEDWGHAYFVPFISMFYVWKHRAAIERARPEVCWPGLGVMMLGIANYVYFITGYSNHMFQGFALILVLAGLLLFLFGARVFSGLVFPLAYLGFAVTISEMIMLKITFGLKLLASQGAWALLNLIGVDTDIAGNILHVHHGGEVTPLNVADACAGMRMVIAFIALAVAVAFLSCPRWWQRIAVMLLAVPVAVLMNVVRVAVLGVATLWDPDFAVGGAHSFIGTVLLVPAFLIFMGCVWLLKQADPLSGKSSSKPASGAKGALS